MCLKVLQTLSVKAVLQIILPLSLSVLQTNKDWNSWENIHMINGCHRDENVIQLIGSTGTWTVYNGFVVAFSVSLGIGVVSGNESDLSQDGKIMDQYHNSTGFGINVSVKYHSSCPNFWSAMRDLWNESSQIFFLSILSKPFCGMSDLFLVKHVCSEKTLKMKVRWKSLFWKGFIHVYVH